MELVNTYIKKKNVTKIVSVTTFPKPNYPLHVFGKREISLELMLSKRHWLTATRSKSKEVPPEAAKNFPAAVEKMPFCCSISITGKTARYPCSLVDLQ